NSGRATFYPITTVKALPLNISEDDMKRYTGYVGIASALIGYEQKFAGIIGYMLGRTVVFDNLDNAGAMARAYGYRVRIVTLDGQLINAGGSFTGGSVRRDSGMLTRTADIARAMSDVERLRGEIAAQNALIAQKNADIKSAEDDAEEQKRRAGLINSLYTAENTQLEVMKNQLGGDQKRLGEVSAELDSLSDGLSDYEGRRAALAGECRELEMRLIALSDEISRLTASRSVLSDKAEDAARRENALDIELTRQSGELSASKNTLDFNISSQTALEDQISRGEALVYELNVKLIEIKNKIETDKRQASELSAAAETCEADKIRLSGEISALEARQNELKNQTRDMTRRRESVFSEYMRLQSERAGIGAEQDKITAKLWEDYELTYSACLALEHDALDDSTRPAAAARQNELRSRIRALGPVNVGALEEYKEVAARYEFLKNQHDDLVKSRDDFNDIIYKLENEMRLRFSDVMEEIDANFKIVFSELFGGGTAEVKLSDPSDVLGSGIDINVAPPGKIIRSMSLLSGGEQAFVAIALFFAILKVNPVPFCILDEIEAALDDVNVYRFAQYCRRGSDRTQFINITHRRGTMEAADVLYGVTMYEKGISKVITLNVAEVEEKTGIKL
ncbi:MAG: chromosome segregation protein SMC, partial [Eubacteriales bacterium]